MADKMAGLNQTFFGNSVILPTSYGPLPDGPSNGAPVNRRQEKKLLIFSGLLAIALLAAILNTWKPNFHAIQNGYLLSSSSKEPKDTKAQKLVPLSRGKPVGVSEKSNRLPVDPNFPDFPWNNSMLSWQRTAFHFQPEKNWMNGTFIIHSPTYLII